MMCFETTGAPAVQSTATPTHIVPGQVHPEETGLNIAARLDRNNAKPMVLLRRSVNNIDIFRSWKGAISDAANVSQKTGLDSC